VSWEYHPLPKGKSMTRKIMICRDSGDSENGTTFHNPLYTLYFVIYLKSSKVGEGFYIIVVKQR
jgi:hypothetical protein